MIQHFILFYMAYFSETYWESFCRGRIGLLAFDNSVFLWLELLLIFYSCKFFENYEELMWLDFKNYEDNLLLFYFLKENKLFLKINQAVNV